MLQPSVFSLIIMGDLNLAFHLLFGGAPTIRLMHCSCDCDAIEFSDFCLTSFFDIIFQIRIETDPADRTQLRMTVASGDPILTFEYVFMIFLAVLLTP